MFLSQSDEVLLQMTAACCETDQWGERKKVGVSESVSSSSEVKDSDVSQHGGDDLSVKPSTQFNLFI